MKKEKSTSAPANKISTQEFDARFDAGEDVSAFLHVSEAVRRVNVDFPEWAVEALDRESGRFGISRQALIKFWVVERLDKLTAAKESGKSIRPSRA